MACDPASVHEWAVSIGLQDCIGQEFCNQFGHLPATISELDNWGTSTGRKTATGWQCLGGGPSPASPPLAPSKPLLPAGDAFTSNIYKFIETNWPLLVGAGAVYLLILKKKVR